MGQPASTPYIQLIRVSAQSLQNLFYKTGVYDQIHFHNPGVSCCSNNWSELRDGLISDSITSYQALLPSVTNSQL